MPTGEVTVRLNLNKDGYSAGMTAARREAQQTVRTIEAMGHTTVSQMQASSAALRVVEGNLTNNIRAAERFISTIPGVGAALQAAFPVVGAIAFLGVISELVERVAKFVQGLNEVPQNPFAGLIASAKLSNDALAITNDRLQLEIEKLEKKPQNRLALALDEMRQASDKLFESLEKSNKAFDDAMAKGGVSTVKGAWRNVTPTDQADAEIKKARAGVQAVTADHQSTIDDALASGDPGNIRQAREALMVDLQKAYAVQDTALRAGLEKAQTAAANFRGSYSVGSDPRAVIQRFSSALQISAQDQQSVGGQYGNSLLTGQRDNDQDKQEQSDLAKAAAKKLLQGMQDALEQQKAQYGMSIAEERSYWQQRESAFKAGSDAYREVVNKVAALEIQMQRQQAESLKAARAEQSSGSRDSSRVLESASAAVAALMKREGEDVLHTGERWKAYNDAVAKGGEIQAANAASFDETRVAIELASGQISKLDAAQQTAAIHARQYASDLGTLQSLRKRIEGDDSLTDVQKQAALQQNSNSQAALEGQYRVRQLADQQAIPDSLRAATRDALGVMVNDWSSMTGQIVQTMTKAIDGLNDDIVNAMMGNGKKADFGKTLSEAGSGLAKAGLQSAEAKVMGAFGLGKPDGTKENPIHTINGGPGGGILGIGSSGQGQNGQGGGGSIWSKLFHSFFGAATGQNDSGGGGAGADTTGGSDGGNDIGYQGGFASGGNFVANRPMLVGERGPELLTPGSAGRIIPNHKLGGSSIVHNLNVDARGSNDPAAIHAAVMRAAPHIIAAANQVSHQQTKRSPHGR